MILKILNNLGGFMNKEEINLLKTQLYLNYYKNDITDRYVRIIDTIVLDKDILNTLNERVYITTLDKYNRLQQENKNYKHIVDELEKWLEETKLKEFEKSYGKRYGKVYTQAEIIVFNMVLNKLQELKGSDNL